jgi:hypothetical protein
LQYKPGANCHFINGFEGEKLSPNGHTVDPTKLSELFTARIVSFSRSEEKSDHNLFLATKKLRFC